MGQYRQVKAFALVAGNDLLEIVRASTPRHARYPARRPA